jgi:hypothetical protein
MPALIMMLDGLPQTDEMPMTKFTFDPSPMQVLVKEKPRHFYHFITTVCAIIGQCTINVPQFA